MIIQHCSKENQRLDSYKHGGLSYPSFYIASSNAKLIMEKARQEKKKSKKKKKKKRHLQKLFCALK